MPQANDRAAPMRVPPGRRKKLPPPSRNGEGGGREGLP